MADRRRVPLRNWRRTGQCGGAERLCDLVNAIGHPGLNVPARPHSNGLPLGVQLVGRFGGENDLFELAPGIPGRAERKVPDFPRW